MHPMSVQKKKTVKRIINRREIFDAIKFHLGVAPLISSDKKGVWDGCLSILKKFQENTFIITDLHPANKSASR